jgi:hypothetical protein
MTFEDQHPLLWQAKTVRCHAGHETPMFTSDSGHCGCGGFEVWATTKDEIRSAHQQHLEYLKNRRNATQPVFAIPSLQTLHELRWSQGAGCLTGVCSACDWRLHSMPRHRIEEAFELHLHDVTAEKTY